MKFHHILVFSFLFLLVVACKTDNRPTQAEYDALLSEKDSIAKIALDLQETIGTVNANLDSINIQEGLLFIDNEDGSKVTKQQILERIQRFKELLARKNLQLAGLEKKGNTDNETMQGLRDLISRLRDELRIKEDRIAALESDLANSKRNIELLHTEIFQAHEDTKKAIQQLGELQEIASTQDQMLNTGYFAIGTAKQLKEKGLVKGIFKKKADFDNIDISHFTQIDIREFTELTINGTQPKILTEKPSSSYYMTTNSNGTVTLHITDPSAFWEASKILIIQVK